MAKQYICACCCSMLEKKVKLLGSQHYNLISMINLIQMEFPSRIPCTGNVTTTNAEDGRLLFQRNVK